MTKPRAIVDRTLAYRVIGLQVSASLTLPVLFWMTAGKNAALAALVGGLIATLANLYFAYQLFRVSGAQFSRDILWAFYRGETGKLVIVMLLFIAAFRLLEGIRESAPYLFAAFAVVYGVAWVAPLFGKGSSNSDLNLK